MLFYDVWCFPSGDLSPQIGCGTKIAILNYVLSMKMFPCLSQDLSSISQRERARMILSRGIFAKFQCILWDARAL